MFEIKPKSEEIVHFYLTFLLFLIKTVLFWFCKVHFLLAVGDMIEQKRFSILDSDYFVDSLNGLPTSIHN